MHEFIVYLCNGARTVCHTNRVFLPHSRVHCLQTLSVGTENNKKVIQFRKYSTTSHTFLCGHRGLRCDNGVNYTILLRYFEKYYLRGLRYACICANILLWNGNRFGF